MTLRTMLAAAAVLSLIATPAVAATANPAASLSVAHSVRAATPATRQSRLMGGAIYGIVGLLVVVGAIIAIESKEKSS